MPATRELLQLQSVDSQLHVRNLRLEEIAKMLGDDARLRSLARQLQTYEGQVTVALPKQADLDNVIGGFTERVEAAEAKLYSGVVVNSRELQDLQADVAMLKRQRGQEEDTLLGVMEELETAQRNRDTTADTLATTTASWTAQQQSLTAEREMLQGEVAQLERDREGVAARIPPPEVALYEQVRKAHPQPIAKMHNNACDTCQVGVPMRLAQEVRTSPTLVRCPHCGRILIPE